MSPLALTSRQRRHLRARAHSLRPVVRLGRQGPQPPALEELDRALGAHELIKVRLVADREERRALLGVLEDRLECAAVGMVGQVAILFRPHPDPAERRIELPP